MFKKIRISLAFKILFLNIILLILALSMCQYAFNISKKAIERSIGETALNITRSVVKIIDTEKFELLQRPEDMNNQYYLKLREQLNNIKNSIGLKYLYTMRKTKEGKYIYVVYGEPMNSTEACPLGTIEEEVSTKMKLSFEGFEGYEFGSTDKWGDLISAFIPIKNKKGDLIGMLGADFEAKHIVYELNNSKKAVLLVSVFIILFGMTISIIFSLLVIGILKNFNQTSDWFKQVIYQFN